jgi:cbb3-type cytochrome oxidase maturation protein
MIILLMLIPLSLMLLAAAIGAFVWAVRKGQFDDMDTPALDILSDDLPARESSAIHGESMEHGDGD